MSNDNEWNCSQASVEKRRHTGATVIIKVTADWGNCKKWDGDFVFLKKHLCDLDDTERLKQIYEETITGIITESKSAVILNKEEVRKGLNLTEEDVANVDLPSIFA